MSEPIEPSGDLVKYAEDKGGVIELFPHKVNELIQRGEVNVINPGFGSRQDQLSNPIATTYVDLPGGRKGLVVSNAWYPDKKVQIFDIKSGELSGIIDDERFNGASAMASDGENIYITDDTTGLIAKFSRDGSRKDWETKAPVRIEDLPGRTPPGFDITKYRHSRMIGSMVVSGDFLYAYNTAASKIQVFNKETGELVREIGKHKIITLDQARTEDLSPDEEMEVQFNGHADIAMLGGQILTSSQGVHWEGAFEIPNEVKIISEEGELRASAKLSSKAGEITGIAADNTNKQVFMAIGNTIGIWGEDGFVGEFTIPGCPGGLYGRVFSINLDEESSDLIISHGSAGAYDTVKKQAVPEYNQIIRLSRTAREELMREAATRRIRMLEVGKLLELGKPEHPISDDEELLVYTDKGEGVIEYRGSNPTIKEIFDLTRNPSSRKHRAVAVSVHDIPVELKKILEFIREQEYVAAFTDEIVFSPILRGKGYVPDRNAVPATEESVGGAVINMESVTDQHVRPGKKIMFINIGKMVEGQIQPREEIEMFDRIVHEARHRETIENVASGREPVENRDNPVLFEKPAFQKQLDALKTLSKAYEERGLVNNVLYLYLRDRIKEVTTQLDTLNRTN